MKTATRLMSCAIAAIALSGCQGFIDKFAFGGKKAERADSTAAIFGSEELQQGRAALKAGYPAAAIQQFRMAALNEKVAPDAFNGLGVAYAKLGRADLAERYFKMALSLDGSNPKFATNLSRFYNSPLGSSARALAMREQEATAQLAAAAETARQQGLIDDPAPTTDRRGSVVLQNPAVKLSRNSSRELMIATNANQSSAPGNGSLPEIAIRHPAAKTNATDGIEEAAENAANSADVGNKAAGGPAQITMPGATSAVRNYPIRITLAKPNSQGSSSPARRAHPHRLALGQRSFNE